MVILAISARTSCEHCGFDHMAWCPWQENLKKGLAYVERAVVSAVRRGRIPKKAAEAIKTMLTPSLSIKRAKDCDMVR